MLSVFVSAKEGELDDERAMAIHIVKFLGLNAIASEHRPALSMSMRDWYEGEVARSDIYLGIFGRYYSAATFEELRIARDNIPVLLFEKEMSYNEKRDPELESKLADIKYGRNNVVIAKYTNAVDLKRKIKDAIIQTLVRRFLDYAKKARAQPAEVQSLEAPVAREGRLLKLGRGTIMNFDFPESVRQERIGVRADFEGSVRFGFLDVMIMTADGRRYWFPDPQTYDGNKDLGTLILEGEKYQGSWSFSLHKSAKRGSAIAFMGMYEDTVELPTHNRRLVSYEVRNFTLM